MKIKRDEEKKEKQPNKKKNDAFYSLQRKS